MTLRTRVIIKKKNMTNEIESYFLMFTQTCPKPNEHQFLSSGYDQSSTQSEQHGRLQING